MGRDPSPYSEKKMIDKKVEKLFTVGGIDVYSNCIYTIQAKPDIREDYSEGLRDYGYKVPFTEEGKSIPSIISADGRQRIAYDFGLSETSEIWYGISDEDAKKEIRNIKKHLIDRYDKEILHNVGSLNSDEILNKKKFVRIRQGQTINTSSVEGLLDLYLIIISKLACDEEDIHNLKYETTNYVIKNSTNIKDAMTSSKIDIEVAKAEMYQLIKSEKAKADAILWYITDNGMALKTEDNTMLFRIFSDWVGSDSRNAKAFLAAFKKISTKAGFKEVQLYGALKRALMRKQIRKENGIYYFEAKPLGKDFNSITKTLIKDKDEDTIIKLINIE